jgi:hypothetical protein
VSKLWISVVGPPAFAPRAPPDSPDLERLVLRDEVLDSVVQVQRDIRVGLQALVEQELREPGCLGELGDDEGAGDVADEHAGHAGKMPFGRTVSGCGLSTPKFFNATPWRKSIKPSEPMTLPSGAVELSRRYSSSLSVYR